MHDDESASDYDPARELDPVKLQAKAVRLQEEGIKLMREAQERAKQGGNVLPVDLIAFTPPTFEDLSAQIRKAWDEAKKILPDAPESVKAHAFQVLLHGYGMVVGR